MRGKSKRLYSNRSMTETQTRQLRRLSVEALQPESALIADCRVISRQTRSMRTPLPLTAPIIRPFNTNDGQGSAQCSTGRGRPKKARKRVLLVFTMHQMG